MMRDLVQVSGASGPPTELIFGDWYPAMRSGELRAGKTETALLLGVPLLREGVPIGALTLTRSTVRPFTDKQIELLTTFADKVAVRDYVADAVGPPRCSAVCTPWCRIGARWSRPSCRRSSSS